jgi:hypothetical protein
MSLVGAALVPAAPVLVAELSGRLRPAASPREAARRAIVGVIATAPDIIVVVAEGDRDESFDSTSALRLHRLGGMHRDDYAPGSRTLPVPLAIGAALLRDAGWVGATSYVAVDAATTPVDALARGEDLVVGEKRVGLLLLGNGSACCTAKAPGSLHPDAEAFNAALLSAIVSGDRDAVLAWTPEAFTTQLSDVRVPLQMLYGMSGSETLAWSTECADEFQGVFYVCASAR